MPFRIDARLPSGCEEIVRLRDGKFERVASDKHLRQASFLEIYDDAAVAEGQQELPLACFTVIPGEAEWDNGLHRVKPGVYLLEIRENGHRLRIGWNSRCYLQPSCRFRLTTDHKVVPVAASDAVDIQLALTVGADGKVLVEKFEIERHAPSGSSEKRMPPLSKILGCKWQYGFTPEDDAVDVTPPLLADFGVKAKRATGSIWKTDVRFERMDGGWSALQFSIKFRLDKGSSIDWKGGIPTLQSSDFRDPGGNKQFTARHRLTSRCGQSVWRDRFEIEVPYATVRRLWNQEFYRPYARSLRTVRDGARASLFPLLGAPMTARNARHGPPGSSCSTPIRDWT